MSFISNTLYDITITPNIKSNDNHLLTSGMKVPGNMTFDQAVNANRILQNGGLICQRQMCETTMGCEDVNVCAARNKDYAKIQEFCGPVGTPVTFMQGSLWRLQPVNAQQTFQATQKQQLGMATLPNPYNVGGGMY